MGAIGRRRLLESAGVLLAAGRISAGNVVSPTIEGDNAGEPLLLRNFEPRSMLHVRETKVLRSRYPVIDIHTHLSSVAKHAGGVGIGEEMQYFATAEDVLPLMDRKNLRIMVNLTGGVGKGLQEAIRKFQTPHPDRFLTFTEPWWERTNQPGYSQFQADEIVRAHQAGARGLKILKTLGLYLREKISTGPLVKVDDKRFDPMWEVCGSLGIPVGIHVSDPEAFFLPIDRFNERFEELNNHPDWSFYGKDFPSNAEILEARNRVLERHPKTQFIVLHVGNDAENLPYVAECMDRFPNMHVEMAARIGELGRQPRMARKFFEKYQDRILFGTDAVPHGTDTPQQIFTDKLYEIYYRFLETEDEYFDYAPAPVPPQGRWRIYGLGLPDEILKKVYYENAARLLQIKI
ncbi:MAG: amidohydrolase [Acidobacteria bacterium]|nr:MAG: amidohydrolase [Acidobacteria bacterium 13_2_20CM_58_27]PYT65705.1 MAG: amidohydrolase [Acidobacteriota bacterium]PYT90544.1 MAG: amidohydrolase [Acidobacteriota bacterium]